MKKIMRGFSLFILLCIPFLLSINAYSKQLDNVDAENVFADLALNCIHHEYPNVIKHMMNTADDVKEPHELYPAFYGCLDWHSAVHGHWLLVRLLNKSKDKVDVPRILAALNKSFTQENIEGELKTYLREGNASFERPYGLAWFLQLTLELRQSRLPEAKKWLDILLPLENAIVKKLSLWLPKLSFPIRTGEHSQTAFAFGLLLDWSRVTNNQSFESLLTSKINSFYLKDKNCPISYEPSGQDFLSPCLAQADLMRRVLDKKNFSAWLYDFFPSLTGDEQVWLAPAVVVDKSDGKLAHLDGVNLSRAWMLEGILSQLDSTDARASALNQAFIEHKKAGLDSVFGDMHYMGSHWLGSFATYLQTKRGME